MSGRGGVWLVLVRLLCLSSAQRGPIKFIWENAGREGWIWMRPESTAAEGGWGRQARAIEYRLSPADRRAEGDLRDTWNVFFVSPSCTLVLG